MRSSLRDAMLDAVASRLGLNSRIASLDERAAIAEARVAHLESLLRQLVATHDDKQHSTPAIQQIWRDAMAEVTR